MTWLQIRIQVQWRWLVIKNLVLQLRSLMLSMWDLLAKLFPQIYMSSVGKTATNDRQSRFCCNLCHSPFQTDLPLKRHQIPKTCDSNGRITFIHFLSSFWELEKGNSDLTLLTPWLLKCHIIAKMTRKHDGFIWTSPVKQNWIKISWAGNFRVKLAEIGWATFRLQ